MKLNKKYEFIAVDFDGTLCEHRFPEIGAPKHDVIKYIKERAEEGTKIILHTCRENEEERRDLDKAVEWCAAHGIPVHAINENPFVSFGGRKIYADIYIDDRAVNVREIENPEYEPEKLAERLELLKKYEELGTLEEVEQDVYNANL